MDAYTTFKSVGKVTGDHWNDIHDELIEYMPDAYAINLTNRIFDILGFEKEENDND